MALSDFFYFSQKFNGLGECHQFLRGLPHLEEAKDTVAPPTLSKVINENTTLVMRDVFLSSTSIICGCFAAYPYIFVSGLLAASVVRLSSEHDAAARMCDRYFQGRMFDSCTNSLHFFYLIYFLHKQSLCDSMNSLSFQPESQMLLRRKYCCDKLCSF